MKPYFDSYRNPDLLPEEMPVVEVQKDSPVRRLIRRMGLGAFTISLTVHTVFLILAIFVFCKWIDPPLAKTEFKPGPKGGGGGGDNGMTVHRILQQRVHMVSNSATSKRLTTNSTNTPFAIPDADNELLSVGPPMNIGLADSGTGGGRGGGHGLGNGTGIGSGSGPGNGKGDGQLQIGNFLPPIFHGRCTEQERLRMLHDAGGTPAVEEGVKRSLHWFKTQQNPDGSWGHGFNVGMTGLVVLAYLGHCEFNNSSEYRDTVSAAISYLMNIGLRNQGKMASSFNGNHWVYEHGIATYALSEALTFSRTQKFPFPELDKVVEQAAGVITAGQNHAGAWNYNYGYDRNDMSVTGWQMQALKAARESKVRIPDLDKTIRNALKYLTEVGYRSGGQFEYSGGGAKPSMTAVGTLCLQQWENGNSIQAKDGVKFIYDGLKGRDGKGPGGPSSLYQVRYTAEYSDLYAYYYACQAMRNAGGREWDAMNKAILEEILPAQAADGQFRSEGGNGTRGAGASTDIFRQALCTLMLEVYYRFLPATSAGHGGGKLGLGNFNDLH